MGFRPSVLAASLALLVGVLPIIPSASLSRSLAASDEGTDDAVAIADQVAAQVQHEANSPADAEVESAVKEAAAAAAKDAAVVSAVSKTRSLSTRREPLETQPIPVSMAPKVATKGSAEAGAIAVDAMEAHIAAERAKDAAKVAKAVAEHSVRITDHAQSALKDAHEALHRARVNTEGLDTSQKESLKKAEAKLREASKAAEIGDMKQAQDAHMEVKNKELERLQQQLDSTKRKSALQEMEEELRELRDMLQQKKGSSTEVLPEEEALKELELELEQLRLQEKSDEPQSHDELKVEIAKLREAISKMEYGTLTVELPKDSGKSPGDAEGPEVEEEDEAERKAREQADKEAIELEKQEEEKHHEASIEVEPSVHRESDVEVTPVEEKGVDIDTQMPYGDLEPFGREDTAQELTESSVKESDQMVDQLERAEVAEEKRAVFRALTRLRGAAITAFDGVARSQTGSIDEYSKTHKWRNSHPLHHLADEESDVSKWAFPDNADF